LKPLAGDVRRHDDGSHPATAFDAGDDALLKSDRVACRHELAVGAFALEQMPLAQQLIDPAFDLGHRRWKGKAEGRPIDVGA